MLYYMYSPPPSLYNIRAIDLGEVALRPHPTYNCRYERICTQKHTARQWAPSETDLERSQWRALPLLSTVVAGEFVSLVAQPDSVPYGRYKNLPLETRAK